MDYQEKLVWGQFVPISGGLLYLALYVAHLSHGVKPWPLVSVLLTFVLLQVVYLIVLSALSKPEPEDERTRLVALKSFKLGYIAVMLVLYLWIQTYLLQPSWFHVLVAHPLLSPILLWFGVEAVRTGTQVALYRASVRA